MMIKLLTVLKQHIYENYSAGKLVQKVHLRYISSKMMFQWHFEMKIPATVYKYYFDLTTLLLKWVLRERMTVSSDLQLLEMGVRGYIPLSGYLSKYTCYTIDAADINGALVENAKKAVDLNHVNVNIIQSDLFSNIPKKKYDIIFWNLPYYLDPNQFLKRLFESVAPYLSDHGELIIGYNSKPLPRKTIMEFAQGAPIYIAEIKEWWWNLHDVIIFKKEQS